MPRMNIRPTMPKAVSQQARFVGRWINGHHTVFDRRNFGHGPGIGTAKELDRVVRELNEGKIVWAA